MRSLEQRVIALEEQLRRVLDGDMPTNRFTVGRGDGQRCEIRFRSGGAIVFDPDSSGDSATGGGMSWTLDGETFTGLSQSMVLEEPDGTTDGTNRTFYLSRPPVGGLIAINEAVYLMNHTALTWDDSEFVIASPHKTPDADDFFYALYWV